MGNNVDNNADNKNNGKNNGKKKHTTFKNVMVVILCTLFAIVYAVAGTLVVTVLSGNSENVISAWLENVETHVNNEAEASAGNSLAKQFIDRKNNNSNENEPQGENLAEPETQTEIQTEAQPETQSQTEIQTEIQDEPETQPETQSQTEPETEAVNEPEPETTNVEENAEETANETETEPQTEGKEETTPAVEVGHVQILDGEDEDIKRTIVTDVTAVVKAAMPCVVAITNEYTSYDYWYNETVDEEASGSGIIVGQNNEELLIVTNYHVIEDNNSLMVKFIDDTEVEAFVKGSSADDDLAIVAVYLSDLGDDTIGSIAIAALGNSDELEVGEPAIAIGNSLGYGQSVTTGIISALNRNIYDEQEDKEAYLIQTDAAINPGNSGGALLNIKGEVIGINSSKIADYVIEGMGYAIPISTARPIIDELVQLETKKKAPEENRGFLGISGTDVSQDAEQKYGMPEGVFVSKVLDGTAAAEAGIRKGDIIVSFDHQTVTQMTELQGILEYYEAGSTVEVVIMRQNDGEYSENTISVTLGKKEE